MNRPKVVSVRGTDCAEWMADPQNVYVGRNCRSVTPGVWWPASLFGNPFKVGVSLATAGKALEQAGAASWDWRGLSRVADDPDAMRLDRPLAVMCYRLWLPTQPHLLELLPTLAGRRLGCWCHPRECHADVIADMVEAI